MKKELYIQIESVDVVCPEGCGEIHTIISPDIWVDYEESYSGKSYFTNLDFCCPDKPKLPGRPPKRIRTTSYRVL